MELPYEWDTKGCTRPQIRIIYQAAIAYFEKQKLQPRPVDGEQWDTQMRSFDNQIADFNDYLNSLVMDTEGCRYAFEEPMLSWLREYGPKL